MHSQSYSHKPCLGLLLHCPIKSVQELLEFHLYKDSIAVVSYISVSFFGLMMAAPFRPFPLRVVFLLLLKFSRRLTDVGGLLRHPCWRYRRFVRSRVLPYTNGSEKQNPTDVPTPFQIMFTPASSVAVFPDSAPSRRCPALCAPAGNHFMCFFVPYYVRDISRIMDI